MHLGRYAQSPLEILSREDIERIVAGSHDILERCGVILEDAGVLRSLEERGSTTLDRERSVVTLPHDLIVECLKDVPRAYSIYGRDGKQAVDLSLENIYAHPGGTDSNVLDVETGERRPSNSSDLADFVRLTDALENLHLATAVVAPSDKPLAQWAHIASIMLRNTVKPISLGATWPRDVEDAVSVFRAFYGDENPLKMRPPFDIYVSPVSPLRYNGDAIQVMRLAIIKGIPLDITPAPIAGISAPRTIAGALALQNAEFLAGLVVSQIFEKGARIQYTPRLSIGDMRTGASLWGVAEMSLIAAAQVQLGRYYGLPVGTYGIATESFAADMQAGYEGAFNALLPALAGATLLSGAGGVSSQNLCSLDRLAIHDEMLGYVFRILRGFSIDEDSLALDITAKVGPDGTFLTQRHTLVHARGDEFRTSRVGFRGSWDDWRRAGFPDSGKQASARAKELLKDHIVPELDDDIARDVRRAVEEREESAKEALRGR